jgi:hypothetical protein
MVVLIDDYFCIPTCNHYYVHYYDSPAGEMIRCIHCGKIRFAFDCWTTKKGQKIPVYELTDKHLVNIIKMCGRNGFVDEETFKEYNENPHSIIAIMATKEWIHKIKEPLPIMNKLLREAEKRKVKLEDYELGDYIDDLHDLQ